MSVFYRQLKSMGTRMDLVLPDVDEEQGEQISGMVAHELDRIEQRLSVYNPGSVISEINRNAFHRRVSLDSEMTDIFEEIELYHTITAGYFDITVKPVLDFLKTRGGERVAFPAELIDKVGFRHVILDKGTIRFKKEGVAIDLGGFGKGYAMRKIKELINQMHVSNALLSFGESLVCGIGRHPFGDSWKVSVPGSENQSEGIKVFELRDESLSVSGNSLNNQKKFGNSGHIFDPVHFSMQSHTGIVVVNSGEPVKSEILSTALFGAGRIYEEVILSKAEGVEIYWMA